MNRTIKRAICAASICAPVFFVAASTGRGAAVPEEGSARVCQPGVVNDASIPNSGQYEHDCRMAAATCAMFGIVGANGADQSGHSGAFGRCFRKAIAADEREYEAWERHEIAQFMSGPKSPINLFYANYSGNFHNHVGQSCDATKKVAAICNGFAPCMVRLADAKCELSPDSGPTPTDFRATDASTGLDVQFLCAATGKQHALGTIGTAYLKISCIGQ